MSELPLRLVWFLEGEKPCYFTILSDCFVPSV